MRCTCAAVQYCLDLGEEGAPCAGNAQCASGQCVVTCPKKGKTKCIFACSGAAGGGGGACMRQQRDECSALRAQRPRLEMRWRRC
jgi:hypothetical protein